MKRERSKQHLTRADYEKFSLHDTRFYGVFYKRGAELSSVKIDPKRMQYICNCQFTETQLHTMSKRKTHYFYPRVHKYYDYSCNLFADTIQGIQEYWENHYKDIIQYAQGRIERPAPKLTGDCELFMQGILDCGEAQSWADMENARDSVIYRGECDLMVRSLYAQFIHQMASRIEAVTVYVLTKKNAIADYFNRNLLYGTSAGKAEHVQALPSFHYYDELYCLWNFIKHSSQSTYEKLVDRFPDVVRTDEPFKQGAFSYLFINFSEKLINDLLDGCTAFFKEYCALVFHEDYDEAQWNFGEYFLDIMRETQEMLTNPTGSPWWL